MGRKTVKIYFDNSTRVVEVKSIKRMMRLCYKYVIPCCFAYNNQKKEKVQSKNYLEIILATNEGFFNNRHWQYIHDGLCYRIIKKEFNIDTKNTEIFLYKFIKYHLVSSHLS